MTPAEISTTQTSLFKSDLTMEHQKGKLHSTVQRREINPSFTLSHLDYFIGFLNMGQKPAETEEQSKSTQPEAGQKLPQKLQLS